MGRNRLKDVFSTNPPLPEIKLLFQNAEAETQFEKAMYLAWDEGHPVNVEGVSGIITYDSSSDRKMPFLFEDNLEGFMVGPSSETRAFDITTPKGMKNVSLECFTFSKRTILRTNKDSIISQEFTFTNTGERTYNAKILKERARELAFEGHRWFDLRRTTRPEIKKEIEDVTYTLVQDDSRYTLRIPQDAIDANPGLLN